MFSDTNKLLRGLDPQRTAMLNREMAARREGDLEKVAAADDDDVFHLAALVDLHKVYGTAVITVLESAQEEVRKALAKGADMEIIELQSLPGDIQTVAPPEFLGWAFNRKPPTEWPKLPADAEYNRFGPHLDEILRKSWSEHIDRLATWNPLENPDDAADFMQLYGIAQDPRHTVRYVLGLKAPPKRPRKAAPAPEAPATNKSDRWNVSTASICEECRLHELPTEKFPLSRPICTACIKQRQREATPAPEPPAEPDCDRKCMCGNDLSRRDGFGLSNTMTIWWCDECGRFIQENTTDGKPHVETYAPKQWFKGQDPE